MIKKITFWLVLITAIGAFLRFYKLSEYPVHLGHDEVSQLYDAISIARTGKDIYGDRLPFIFQSVNDFKPPFYTYATVLVYKIFGWQEVTIRITGALFGTLLIPAVYFFVEKFLRKKKTALIAAALTAISPFEIFYSRKSFENQTGIFLVLIGFTLLIMYVRKKNDKFFYWGAAILGAAAYVYFAQAVLIPLLLISFTIIFWKKLKPLNIKPLFVFLAVITPLYYLIFVNPDARNRSSAVFVTQDPRLGEMLSEKESQLSRLFTIGSYSAGRYLKQFSPKYLFLDGLDMTEGKRDVGPLFAVSLPFFIAGVYFLVRQKENRKERLFLLSWVLIGMIPSGVTFEDYSPHRAIMVFTAFNIISAVGIYWFFKKFGRVALLILLVLFGANLTFFVKRYTINLPIERSEALHYPYEQLAKFAWENYDNYDQIVFDPKFGEFAPWIGTGAHYYLAFYGQYPPEKMQVEFKIGDQAVRETVFGKFSIRAVFWPEDMILRKTLIIASPWSLPDDIEEKGDIIKTFYFRSTAPAFYALEL